MHTKVRKVSQALKRCDTHVQRKELIRCNCPALTMSINQPNNQATKQPSNNPASHQCETQIPCIDFVNVIDVLLESGSMHLVLRMRITEPTRLFWQRAKGAFAIPPPCD